MCIGGYLSTVPPEASTGARNEAGAPALPEVFGIAGAIRVSSGGDVGGGVGREPRDGCLVPGRVLSSRPRQSGTGR
jgi:hypothetical protein